MQLAQQPIGARQRQLDPEPALDHGPRVAPAPSHHAVPLDIRTGQHPGLDLGPLLGVELAPPARARVVAQGRRTACAPRASQRYRVARPMPPARAATSTAMPSRTLAIARSRTRLRGLRSTRAKARSSVALTIPISTSAGVRKTRLRNFRKPYKTYIPWRGRRSQLLPVRPQRPSPGQDACSTPR